MITPNEIAMWLETHHQKRGKENDAIIPNMWLEAYRQKQYAASLPHKNGEQLNEYVKQALDKTLNEEWVMNEIDKAVTECALANIKNMANSHAIQGTIGNAIAEILARKFKDLK